VVAAPAEKLNVNEAGDRFKAPQVPAAFREKRLVGDETFWNSGMEVIEEDAPTAPRLPLTATFAVAIKVEICTYTPKSNSSKVLELALNTSQTAPALLRTICDEPSGGLGGAWGCDAENAPLSLVTNLAVRVADDPKLTGSTQIRTPGGTPEN
jgi:hypothetical protein